MWMRDKNKQKVLLILILTHTLSSPGERLSQIAILGAYLFDLLSCQYTATRLTVLPIEVSKTVVAFNRLSHDTR